MGTYRAYIVEFLRNHPMINQDLTFLVRHLAPTSQGLPVEIHVFSKDKDWANYEAIQVDIFIHLLAVIPGFDLHGFQQPAGCRHSHTNGEFDRLAAGCELIPGMIFVVTS